LSELGIIGRHAGTVLAGQLATMAFGVTDTIVAGRFSQQALAALSVGAAVYITVFVALLGVLQALLPAWAELHGAGRKVEVGRSVRQSLYLAMLAAVAGVLGLLFPGALLEATDVPATLQADVRAYLAVLALALPPALAFRLFSTLNQSLGKPRLVTWLQLGSLLLKVPLTIWFVFGGFGVPAMGAVGCAWATVVVN
jgi:MATE family multidrug resistance protein